MRISLKNRLLGNNVQQKDTTALTALGKALRNERRKCRREGKADDRGWKKGCFVLVLKKKPKNKNTLILFLRHSRLISVFCPSSPNCDIQRFQDKTRLRIIHKNSAIISPTANKLFTLIVYLLLSLGLQPWNSFCRHYSYFLVNRKPPQICITVNSFASFIFWER